MDSLALFRIRLCFFSAPAQLLARLCDWHLKWLILITDLQYSISTQSSLGPVFFFFFLNTADNLLKLIAVSWTQLKKSGEELEELSHRWRLATGRSGARF